MMYKHGQITDAECYLEDNSLLGVGTSLDIPDLEHGYIEHESLGSVGVLKLPKRGLQAMDFKLVLEYPEPELMGRFYDPTKAQLLQLHDKLDLFDESGFDSANSTTRVTIIRVMPGKVVDGSAKKGDERKPEIEGSVHYFMQRLSNSETPLVEINLFTNKYEVMGKPVWS